MATELELREAVKVLKRLSSKVGKRKTRMEEIGMEDNRQRLRALEGLCGSCDNLNIEIAHFDGKPRAMLRCLQMNSPVDLFRKTDWGQEAVCPDFELFKM